MRVDEDAAAGWAGDQRPHPLRVKARGPGCLLMAIFQGDLYVGGRGENSGPFLVWHEAFAWALDRLAATKPESGGAPPSQESLLTLVRGLTQRLAPGRRRNRFWALPRAWLQRLRRSGRLRLSGSHVCLLDRDGPRPAPCQTATEHALSPTAYFREIMAFLLDVLSALHPGYAMPLEITRETDLLMTVLSLF
ncbi:BBLF3 [Macacine gammaherpesvirus 4]|uniref:BBLF3 n=1 Tax=Macacine gammaherpesvirus 4 TaxID=45455 RepID=Q8UZG4_9GAMA|nr:BBLF3 [Macacine gammaherpesvirus 4]AAK95447.1 BBLF3 [Macacine gammaherpesvirus 4]